MGTTKPRTCCQTHGDVCGFGRDHVWSGPYLLDEGRDTEQGKWSQPGDVKCTSCGGTCTADREPASSHPHHFNSVGTAVVCTAPEDADCRKRSHCDSEGWHFDTGCTEHDGKHPALPGSDCWMTEYINAIEITETYEDYENPPEIIPGAAIDLEFIGRDEGCCWSYAEGDTMTPAADPRIEAGARELYKLGAIRTYDWKTGLHTVMTPWEYLSPDVQAQFREVSSTALAAADAVDPLRQPGHRVQISQFSWTLQHPSECRPDMLACRVTQALQRTGVSGVDDGIWSVELGADGKLLGFGPVVTL